MIEIQTTNSETMAAVPELSFEQAQEAYDLCGSQVHQCVETLLHSVPESDREKSQKILQRTLGYIALEALIEARIAQNAATERAPHLVIDNVQLFVDAQPSRIEAMSQAALEYLHQTYPEFVTSDTPNVVSGTNGQASEVSFKPTVLEKAA